MRLTMEVCKGRQLLSAPYYVFLRESLQVVLLARYVPVWTSHHPGCFPPRFRERFAVPAGAVGAQRKGRACKELQRPLPRCSHVFCGQRQQFSRKETWHHTAFRRRKRAPAGSVGGRLNYANQHLGRAVG